MIKNQTTMKEQLLIDHGYKYLWFIVLGAFLLVLILPFFKSVDLSVGTLGLLLSAISFGGSIDNIFSAQTYYLYYKFGFGLAISSNN